MVAIHFDDWGFEMAQDVLAIAKFCVPAQPACRRWQTETTYDTDMKFFASVYYEATEAKYGFQIRIDDDGPDNGFGPTLPIALTPQWDQAYADAEAVGDYPTNPSSLPGKPANRFMPYYRGHLTVYPNSAELGTGYVYGFDLFAHHDEAYDGRDMELFDLDGTSGAYQDDCSAASFILTRMVVDATNRMIWDSGFRIGAVVVDPTAPGGP